MKIVSSSDRFQLLHVRLSAGHCLDSAFYRIRRVVDSTEVGSIDFHNQGVWANGGRIWYGGNTTVDSNQFIKKAS